MESPRGAATVLKGPAQVGKDEMDQMRLGKYHGLGNDFLVALEAHNPNIAADPDLARHLCDRYLGVGADGLIIGLAPKDPAHDAAMVLLNSDGSRAEISGNGIRCLAQALLRAGSGGGGSKLLIETDGGLRPVALASGDPARRAMFTVDMGSTSEGPDPTEATRQWGAANVATVDIGNPHLVLEVGDVDAVQVERDGAELEAGYPAGINVHFVSVRDAAHLDLRVWERGAGVTRACGSGAAAAVVAAAGWGGVDPVDRPVEVAMPGGRAEVQLDGDRVLLTGESVFVADVVVPVDPGNAAGERAR